MSFVNDYEVYTDGALKNGVSTWAFVVVQNDKVVFESSGRERRVGSNHMEFRAAIEALKWLPKNSKTLMHSDSRILIDAFDSKILNNRPLIFSNELKTLDKLILEHQKISWKWVKAHSGKKHNERCDELCVLARI